jgi:hypothetical protein
VAQSFHLRALRIAARQLGGKPQLRAYLSVPSTDLYRWMRGEAPVPRSVMVKVIAFLAEREESPAPAIDTPQSAEEKRNLG